MTELVRQETTLSTYDFFYCIRRIRAALQESDFQSAALWTTEAEKAYKADMEVEFETAGRVIASRRTLASAALDGDDLADLKWTQECAK